MARDVDEEQTPSKGILPSGLQNTLLGQFVACPDAQDFVSIELLCHRRRHLGHDLRNRAGCCAHGVELGHLSVLGSADSCRPALSFLDLWNPHSSDCGGFVGIPGNLLVPLTRTSRLASTAPGRRPAGLAFQTGAIADEGEILALGAGFVHGDPRQIRRELCKG